MKKLTATFLTVLICLRLITGEAAFSADLQKGLEAYESQDYETALRELQPLAEQGNAEALVHLAFMYEDGSGVPKNQKLTVKFMRQAALKGHANGQAMLGWYYEKGLGISKDTKEAFKWYERAAKQGKPAHQAKLAEQYRFGIGTVRNYKEAFRWYKRSSEQGFSAAQNNLGHMYEKGQGTSKNYIQAYAWYSISASAGDKESREALDRLEEWMPPNQVKKSQELASSWQPTAEKSPPVTARSSPNKPTPKKPRMKRGSSGSGFFVSKMGHVVTNAHVVKKCTNVTVGSDANTQSSAEVLSKDTKNDLALLKLSSMSMASSETKSLISNMGINIVPSATRGLLRSDDVQLGEKVLVSGFPFGEMVSNTIKVTQGIVSATRGLGDDTAQFQIDAAVQPGNSGGPIYDGNGNVVGVVVSRLNKMKVAKAIGALPENVNFGIKGSTVRQFLTTSGLPTKWATNKRQMSTQQLAQIAQKQTVMVMCKR